MGRPADDVVADWIRQRAHPLTTSAPDAPAADLAPLGDMLRSAEVVGLGRPTHGSRELTEHTHRILRFLVERLGFRSLAVEDDWAKGVELDEHVRTGAGDPRELLTDAWPHYRTEELLAVIGWMRARNQRHPDDPVRFVGVDVSGAQGLAYDAVADHVRRNAPERLAELAAHHDALRGGVGAEDAVEVAERAHDLVAELPSAPGRALALQHARAIVGHHATAAADDHIEELEPRMADNLVQWHEHTGHKIVYWGGCTHTCVGHSRQVRFSTGASGSHRNAGSRLRERFGTGYVSVGMTFGRGTVQPGGTPQPVPSPPQGFTEAVLSRVDLAQYALDLRTGGPPAVRDWLTSPAKLRLFGPSPDPVDDPSHMTGGPLAELFDVLVHTTRTGPVRYL
ncbi:erythromycin esterase family protein [Saccharopolyspora erythraea]|uniref:erythromycin esterase family protein n=1 Tax=Saccharopolyspora erythraea TaxID=1836 RepID=UPI001BA5CE0F|nr:erythromycin esterase family protein [Saccharopolyspora erythraea]QUH00686.1 erythromycin esterase family protein [Saccharopolyspora erythraea]